MNPSTLCVHVARKNTEALDIATFELVSAGSPSRCTAFAGSHIDVHLPNGMRWGKSHSLSVRCLCCAKKGGIDNTLAMTDRLYEVFARRKAEATGRYVWPSSRMVQAGMSILKGKRVRPHEDRQHHGLQSLGDRPCCAEGRSGSANLNSAISGNSGHDAGSSELATGVFDGQEISAAHPPHPYAGIQRRRWPWRPMSCTWSTLSWARACCATSYGAKASRWAVGMSRH